MKLTTSFALFPGAISGVFLPLILKSCGSLPAFLTAKVTTPGLEITFVARTNLNSLALTETVVALARSSFAPLPEATGTLARSDPSATTARIELILSLVFVGRGCLPIAAGPLVLF